MRVDVQRMTALLVARAPFCTVSHLMQFGEGNAIERAEQRVRCRTISAQVAKHIRRTRLKRIRTHADGLTEVILHPVWQQWATDPRRAVGCEGVQCVRRRTPPAAVESVRNVHRHDVLGITKRSHARRYRSSRVDALQLQSLHTTRRSGQGNIHQPIQTILACHNPRRHISDDQIFEGQCDANATILWQRISDGKADSQMSVSPCCRVHRTNLHLREGPRNKVE